MLVLKVVEAAFQETSINEQPSNSLAVEFDITNERFSIGVQTEQEKVSTKDQEVKSFFLLTFLLLNVESYLFYLLPRR